jgi:glycerol-1-phosphate dehydrogenase [NAD(P)+]
MSSINSDPLFGKDFSCKCGKTHCIYPRKVVYSEDGVAQVPNLAGQFHLGHRLALLADIRTREVAGAELEAALTGEGYDVTPVLVEDRAGGDWPICDDITKQKLEEQIGDVDWILPAGSGVLNDLGKWLAFERKIPFVVFATAASMNGYASANTAPTIKGMKKLAFARPPIVIVSSPSVICGAPFELTMAGLGDVVAKTVSTTDWYLNHLLFGDYYCEKSAELIAEIEPLYLNNPEGLNSRNPTSIEALFHALLLTGVAMNMAETTAPASGAEHLISHALDMTSSTSGVSHDLHGRQVGVGTILAAEIYRRVLSVEAPTFTEPTEKVDVSFWGPLGDFVMENYTQKIQRLKIVKEKLTKATAWDDLREQLSTMVKSPEVLRDCLGRAGGATKAEHIRCSRSRLREILCRAYAIRPRVTIFDLAQLIGIMPSAADDIVEEWA